MELITNTPKKFGREFLIGTGIPLVLLIGTTLLSVFVAYPKYKDLPTKREEFKKQTDLNIALETKLKKLEDLTDFKDVINEDSRLINSAIPSQDDIPLLLTQIQNIAKESGLTITNLTYSSTSGASSKEADKVNVQLSIKGSYSQVKQFFYALEKAARIVDVTTLRFSSSIEGKETDALTSAELEISLGLSSPFYFVESKATTDDPITIDIKDPTFLTFVNKLKQFKIYDTKVDNSNIGKENPFK